MSRMSIPQLVKAFNGIPRREEVVNALATTQAFQCRGHSEYEISQAGEALIAYYQRMEMSAMKKHERRIKHDSTYSLEIASRFRERAKAIETRLKEMKECEDHEGIVQHRAEG